MRVTILFFYIILGLGFIFNLQVIPEKIKLAFINSSYIEWAKVALTRYSRKGTTYYINLEGKTLHSWANNVTIQLMFYEFLHNEYRRSFVELHFKFCEMVESDPYLGPMLQNVGISCPLPANEYHLMNMTLPIQSFPNVWPFEKGQVQIEAIYNPTNAYIFKLHVSAIWKAEKKIDKPKLH